MSRRTSLILGIASMLCSVAMIGILLSGKLRSGPAVLRDAVVSQDDADCSKDNRKYGLVVPNALVYEIVDGEPVSTQKVIPDYTRCEVLKEFPHKTGNFALICVPSYQNGYFIVSEKNVFVLN